MNHLKNIQDLIKNIKELLYKAHHETIRHINLSMVSTYFEIGRMIFEEEQKGKDRADYGERIINKLSLELIKEFGKGFSERNLKNMRQFYVTFQIGQTVSAQSFNIKNERKYYTWQLSWSHYVFLMRLDEPIRDFYEIEATENNWSLRDWYIIMRR